MDKGKINNSFLGTKEPEFIEKYISIWRNISKPVLAKNFNEEILIISGRTMKMVIERTAQFGKECKKLKKLPIKKRHFFALRENEFFSHHLAIYRFHKFLNKGDLILKIDISDQDKVTADCHASVCYFE